VGEGKERRGREGELKSLIYSLVREGNEKGSSLI
jgi:hypothetical protein